MILAANPSPSRVSLVTDAQGAWHLMRNDEPYTVRGAGGQGNLELLRAIGGNTIRTWGAGQLESSPTGSPGLLDRCEALGLTAMVGIWVDHARHGFDYGDPAAIQAQRDRVRATVRRYKDHPALLIWGLGNEMEGDGTDPRIWQELAVLAKIVREEDPNHPICTVLAGFYNDKISLMLAQEHAFDILGINIYTGAERVDSELARQGWNGPFMVTEYGPAGHWEVAKTSWGAPLEPSAAAKARAYAAAYDAVTYEGRGLCLGSFCFIWGQKQEKTATWYGMFLPTGERTPVVDVMARAWTGSDPELRSPIIHNLRSAAAEKEIAPGSQFHVTAIVTDPNTSELQYEWQVVAESTEIKFGGDPEKVPALIPGCIRQHDGANAEIQAPSTPGAYRLFLYVRDGHGGGAAGNFPFFVK